MPEEKDLIVDNAYYKNNRIDFKDRKHPLFVGSCGMFRLISRPRLPTYRPRGRLDFQLLYVAHGRAYFYFNGKRQIVNAGNMVLYRPREEQRYYYYGVDRTEVYWVHFTGNDVTNILRKYGFKDHEHVIYTGTSVEYKNLFQRMIEERKGNRTDNEELLVMYLREIFIMIHRLDGEHVTPKNPFLSEEMVHAVAYFHENYRKQISIEEYAAARGMSISWFIRSFKRYTGHTPNQYILSLRISNAQILLETTAYSVQEIASVVGYDNPLYFSRLFHKLCGQSPREFRDQFKEEEKDVEGRKGKDGIEFGE